MGTQTPCGGGCAGGSTGAGDPRRLGGAGGTLVPGSREDRCPCSI